MTAEELLAAMAEPLPEDDGYCIIDPETRVITIPPEYQLLGVESDEKAERIYFKCPKIVGDDSDLSKLALRVNFRNAGQVVDQYLVDDVAVDGDNITFSWLLSRRVTQYEGDVNFIVCAVRVSGETVTNEWNTTLATAQVLEGLEAEIVLPEEETDIVNQLLALAETRLNDVRDATSAANTAASNANQKAQEAVNATEDARAVTEQITKDSYLHTALQSFIDTVTASPTAYGNAIVKKIEGFIRQETTTGAQLFDAFHVDVANGARNAKALNGGKDVQVTGKKSDSGTGHAYYTIPASLVDGKSIYVYGEYSGNASFSISIKKSDNTWLNTGIPTRTWAKIDIPQGVLQASVVLYPNGVTATDETAIFKNIKVGFTQFEIWEPYTGGQPAPNPDYPMVVQGTGYRGFFDDLYEFVYHGGNDVVNRNNEWVASVNKIPCKSGDSVEIIYHRSNSNSMYGIIYYKGDDFVSILATQRGNGKFAVPSGVDGFRWQVYESGVQPDPSFVDVKINGKYAVVVKSEGKNLFDLSKVEYGKAISNDTGNTFDALEDIATDYIHVDGSSYIYAKPMSIRQWMGFYSETYDYISGWSEYGKIQVPSNAVYARFTVAKADMYEWYVIKGENALEEYIPYQSNVTYIPVDYPLFEGDKIVQRNGEYKLLRKWGFKTYDGSDDENWNIVYNEENNVYNVYIADMMNDGKRGVLVPNNYFYNNEYGYALHSSYISSSGNYNIIISPDMHIDAVQEWKDWLKIHTMYCAYELATPTEEPLSPEAVKALNSIMATDEQTELTIAGIPADAGIQNQFLLPRNEDGALNTTAYCTAKRNEIALEELENATAARLSALETQALQEV